MAIKGGCLCGKIRYIVTGSLLNADHCHCSMCRRQHGAAFSTYAGFNPGDFIWTSGEDLVKVYEVLSGGGWCFCSECGSTLAGTDNGKIKTITLGTVEGEPGIKPASHIFIGSKAQWHDINDDLPQFEERPPDTWEPPNRGGLMSGAIDASTFLGISACEDLDSLDASSAIIGVPGATPYGSMGAFCRNAPNALRTSISEEIPLIDRHNFDIDGPVFPQGCKHAVDCGDLAWDENDYAKNRALITSTVAKVREKGAIPIVIGGDDSVPIPMLDALADTGDVFTVLQIDAHIDWRDSYMGESYGLSSNMRRASEMDYIKQIIQVGIRGLGSGHASDFQDALDWGVHFFPAATIHRDGVEQVFECIDSGTNVVICLDVDGLDPSIVPGVSARSPGGLTYFQALDLIKGVAGKGRIAAIDFAEFLPEADVDGLGALTVSRLIAATMGILARQQSISS